MSTVQREEDLILKIGTNQIELLEFSLEKEKPDGSIYSGIYGINVSKVLEVVRLSPLTEIPNSPSYVLGLMNLRGDSIPVVSLAAWMGIQEKEPDEKLNKIIISEFNNTRIGFLVQQTNRIRRIAWEDIKVPPDM